MGRPVVTVAAGGLPVCEALNGFGTPVDEAANGFGRAVTKVTNGLGMPVVYGAGAVDWVDQFTLDTGQKPSIALDFVNGKYYDGSSNAAALSSMLSNTTVNVNGLLCDSAAKNSAIGPLQTALRASAITIYMETFGGTNGQSLGLLGCSSGAPDGLLEENTNSFFSWNGTAARAPSNLDWTITNPLAFSMDGSGGIVGAAGQANASVPAWSSRAAATFKLGSWSGAYPFGGYIKKFVVYPIKVPTKYIKNMTWPIVRFPFNGMNGYSMFGAGGNGYLKAGQPASDYFIKNAPWTIVCAGLMTNDINAMAVVFTNVHNGGAPWFGHELWIPGAPDTTGFGGTAGQGKMRIHLMSGWPGAGSHTDSLQLNGSTRLTDGLWHVFGASYDGSGTPAGCKMYVDGVAETLSTDDNALGVSTSLSGTELEVGGQWGGYAYHYMSFCAIYKEVKSAAWWANITATQKRPPVDASSLVYFDFTEAAGTTTVDRSANHYNGTLIPGAWF